MGEAAQLYPKRILVLGGSGMLGHKMFLLNTQHTLTDRKGVLPELI